MVNSEKFQIDNRSIMVSVIIPYYQRADHLMQTLTALIDQSVHLDNYEVIVVDDGSDRSVADFIPSCIKLIRTPHKGAAAARNSGIAIAKGEVFIFLDSDIVVNKKFVESHYNFHEQYPKMVGLGFRRHMNEKGIAQTTDTRLKLLTRYKKNVSNLSHPWFMTYTCNVSVPKEMAITEPFDNNYFTWGLEDSEWAYRLHCRGYGFAFIEAATATHLYHDRTMTDKKFEGWKKNLAYTIQKHPELSILEVFEYVFDPKLKADYFDAYDKFEGFRCATF